MADEIRADYDQLDEIANRFANQAQEVQEMRQKVQSSFQKLRDGGWIGEAATRFFDEMESRVFPVTDRLKEALEHASSNIQTISQTVRQAEQEASSLFKSEGIGGSIGGRIGGVF